MYSQQCRKPVIHFGFPVSFSWVTWYIYTKRTLWLHPDFKSNSRQPHAVPFSLFESSHPCSPSSSCCWRWKMNKDQQNKPNADQRERKKNPQKNMNFLKYLTRRFLVLVHVCVISLHFLKAKDSVTQRATRTKQQCDWLILKTHLL